MKEHENRFEVVRFDQSLMAPREWIIVTGCPFTHEVNRSSADQDQYGQDAESRMHGRGEFSHASPAYQSRCFSVGVREAPAAAMANWMEPILPDSRQGSDIEIDSELQIHWDKYSEPCDMTSLRGYLNWRMRPNED